MTEPVSDAVIRIDNVSKTYASGFTALHGVTLDIKRGEIFALLGPNGAGKTTLISIICGIVTKSGGTVTVGGHDINTDWRAARKLIGIVPQELTTDMAETVWNTVRLSRGLFGLPPNPAYLEKILKDLALWDKRGTRIRALSGGMKRRVLIAKALAHEPKVLFLDEPTAGVDVSLRRSMWDMVWRLREEGVTVILTTHYLEEAEEMADRIGVITGGKLQLVENKAALMNQLGRKELVVHLAQPLAEMPAALAGEPVTLSADGLTLTYTYRKDGEKGIGGFLRQLDVAGITFEDVRTRESSLEDIFVDIVGDAA